MSLEKFVLKMQYKKVQGLGDRLDHIKEVIEWERFRPFFSELFFDNEETGGRPHYDEIVMMKILVLQRFYGLSDQEAEFQINDRTSFKNFLGFPEKIPDYTTIWGLKERLQKSGTLEKIWNELQQQLEDKNLKVKNGVIQDASFIEADFGKKRHYKEKKANPMERKSNTLKSKKRIWTRTEHSRQNTTRCILATSFTRRLTLTMV